MTWPKVIIFAIAAGVYTALMALWVPASCSFHDITVTVEAWIPLALIVMVNCKGPLESALKTFVFFLISQPLVYLIQVPFSDMGWGLFGYYRYWFYITLCTLPAAFIGWSVKKNNIIAALILSPMLVLQRSSRCSSLNGTPVVRCPFPQMYCWPLKPMTLTAAGVHPWRMRTLPRRRYLPILTEKQS